MTDDQEAKILLVGSTASKYFEDIIWSYCPGENNPDYPKDFFIHETKRNEWILQRGEYKTLYSSFEEAVKACVSFVIECRADKVASRMLVDDGYSKLIVKAGM